jgi:Skp family chaperone for outer membrane proteins
LAAAILAILVAVSGVARLAAQAPAGRPATGPTSTVAVVDIAQIYKGMNSFKAQMEMMSKEVKAAEDKLNAERLQLNRMVEKLKELRPGTPDFKRLEQDIAQKQADFQVRGNLHKRDFMEKEAAIYYKTYQEINEVIRQYSESRGITLVLRFSNDQVDPTDRDSVFRELTKAVVYQHSSDISQIILDEMNRRSGPSGTGPTGNNPTAQPRGPMGPGGVQPGAQMATPPAGPGSPSGLRK